MKDMIDLVDAFVEKCKREDEKYGDYVALGRLKALMSTGMERMQAVIDAMDHSPEEAMIHLRYAVQGCKNFIKYIEEETSC